MDIYKKGFLVSKCSFGLLILAWFLFIPQLAISSSVEVPGAADAGKFKADDQKVKSFKEKSSNKFPEITRKAPQKPVTPEEANNFQFFLSEVNIKGITALRPSLVRKIYFPYLRRIITLKEAYRLVEQITELYNEKGYFLSIAYLPDQKIDEKAGVLEIVVIEGYIHNIQLPAETKKYNKRIFSYLKDLLKQRPINIKFLENYMMRVNDLFGYKFKGTLVSLNDVNTGAVKLVLSATEKPKIGKLSFDNFASKAVGPHQFKFLHNQPLSPFNQTKLLLGGNVFLIKKFNYVNATHTFILNKNVSLDFAGGITRMKPSGAFSNLEIKSNSSNLNTSLIYKLFYQRDSSLDLKVTFGLQNASNNILGSTFSKDKIRTIKFSTSYYASGVKDYGFIDFIFTRGLSILHASKNQDPDISRSGAGPNFNKFELNVVYYNYIYNNFSLLFGVYGQYANRIMFSSEEFGYGGQTFGKAFDSSQISGDKGINTNIELSYSGWLNSKYWKPVPYAYFDMGVVWRKDPTRVSKETGASCGFGKRSTLFNFVNLNVGLAWPINRKIEKPIYGQKPRAPRILLELSFSSF